MLYNQNANKNSNFRRRLFAIVALQNKNERFKSCYFLSDFRFLTAFFFLHIAQFELYPQ